MKHYFYLLGIKPDADFSDVKKAYRKAVLKYHPDSNGGVGDTDRFKEVVKAYQAIQRHYKAVGVTSQKSLSKRFSLFLEKINPFVGLPNFQQNEIGETPRKIRIYNGDYVDAIVADLSFKELSMRFQESDNAHVKKQAARGLAFHSGHMAIPIFKQELMRCSADTAEDIIFALGLINHRQSAHMLERYLKSTDLRIACTAINALKNITKDPARAALYRIEKEGRALGNYFSTMFANRQLKVFVKLGFIDDSEFFIATALRKQTSTSVPKILEQLGWELPGSASA